MNYLRGKLHSCRNLFLLFLLLFSVQAGAEPATCTWDDGWDPQAPVEGDHIVIAGGDLTWGASLPDTVGSWTQDATYAGTVTFQTVFGETGFTEFTIEGDAAINGGTWTHPANTGTEQYRLKVSVGGDLKVGESGSIDVDGKGIAGSSGPGYGGSNRDGAGYGGVGGSYTANAPGSITYGSITEPFNLGSGVDGGGGNGGEAIYLSVAGSIVLKGAISSEGGKVNHRGGGSGGSFYMAGWSISGSGSISVNGGDGWGSGAGGGGGRAAVVLSGEDSDFSEFSGDITAYGGESDKDLRQGGAAGTVYKQDGKQANGTGELVIDNNNNDSQTTGHVTTLMPAGVNVSDFSQVTIRNGGELGIDRDSVIDFGAVAISGEGAGNSFVTIYDDKGVTFPDPFVISGYTLRLDAALTATGDWIISSTGAPSHSSFVSETDAFKLDVTLDGNLTIDNGGAIDVLGQGHLPLNVFGGGTMRDGAAHGGLGGNYDIGFSTVTYGSVMVPVSWGSGAGTIWTSPHGSGGGAVQLTISGTTTVNGKIIADGGEVADHRGAGSGGGVYVTTAALAGNGSISANGGVSLGSGGSSGGGGRVAVFLTSANDPGSVSVTAYGGVDGAANQSGAAGTVYLETASDAPGGGKLIINNPHTHTTASGVLTELPASYAPLSFPDELQRVTLIIRGNGKVGLTADITVGDLIFE